MNIPIKKSHEKILYFKVKKIDVGKSNPEKTFLIARNYQINNFSLLWDATMNLKLRHSTERKKEDYFFTLSCFNFSRFS